MAGEREGGGWNLNIVLLSQTATKAFRSGWSWNEIASESSEIYDPRGFSLLPQPNILSPQLFSRSPIRPLANTEPSRLHPPLSFRLDFLSRKWIFMKDVNNERDNFLFSRAILVYNANPLCLFRHFPFCILQPRCFRLFRLARVCIFCDIVPNARRLLFTEAPCIHTYIFASPHPPQTRLIWCGNSVAIEISTK